MCDGEKSRITCPLNTQVAQLPFQGSFSFSMDCGYKPNVTQILVLYILRHISNQSLSTDWETILRKKNLINPVKHRYMKSSLKAQKEV